MAEGGLRTGERVHDDARNVRFEQSLVVFFTAYVGTGIAVKLEAIPDGHVSHGVKALKGQLDVSRRSGRLTVFLEAHD